MESHADRPPADAGYADEPRPDAGWERRDASIGRIVLAGVALAAAAAATLAVCVWMFDAFAAESARRDVPISEIPEARKRELPPPPRLQTSPRQDLHDMREQEDRTLQEYGWIDPKAEIVRIPIERAMELLAERGLPARGAVQGGARAGGTVPPKEAW
ncbi:MAG: hypothetical protein QOD06_1394 [Candidatus Binatota bacterium]|nr:hypothetical protein [Candidatus Binatota bacterium]